MKLSTTGMATDPDLIAGVDAPSTSTGTEAPTEATGQDWAALFGGNGDGASATEAGEPEASGDDTETPTVAEASAESGPTSTAPPSPLPSADAEPTERPTEQPEAGEAAESTEPGEPTTVETAGASEEAPETPERTPETSEVADEATRDWIKQVYRAREATCREEECHRNLKSELDELKTQVKEAAESVGTANRELGKIIDKGPEQMPLFDSAAKGTEDTPSSATESAESNDEPATGPPEPPTASTESTEPATKAPDDPNRWKALLVTELVACGLSKAICKTLVKKGRPTLGSLQVQGDYDGYSNMPGVGPKTSDKIADAFEVFWTKHPEFCQAAADEAMEAQGPVTGDASDVDADGADDIHYEDGSEDGVSVPPDENDAAEQALCEDTHPND